MVSVSGRNCASGLPSYRTPTIVKTPAHLPKPAPYYLRTAGATSVTDQRSATASKRDTIGAQCMAHFPLSGSGSNKPLASLGTYQAGNCTSTTSRKPCICHSASSNGSSMADGGPDPESRCTTPPAGSYIPNEDYFNEPSGGMQHGMGPSADKSNPPPNQPTQPATTGSTRSKPPAPTFTIISSSCDAGGGSSSSNKGTSSASTTLLAGPPRQRQQELRSHLYGHSRFSRGSPHVYMFQLGPLTNVLLTPDDDGSTPPSAAQLALANVTAQCHRASQEVHLVLQGFGSTAAAAQQMTAAKLDQLRWRWQTITSTITSNTIASNNSGSNAPILDGMHSSSSSSAASSFQAADVQQAAARVVLVVVAALAVAMAVSAILSVHSSQTSCPSHWLVLSSTRQSWGHRPQSPGLGPEAATAAAPAPPLVTQCDASPMQASSWWHSWGK